MKKVEAFIKEHRLDEVAAALHHVDGLTGMTVTDARGYGRAGNGGRRADEFRGTIHVEVFCTDRLVEPVVAAIEKAAHTGLRGDGKIYVLPVEEAIRISSGERGEPAV